MTETNNLVTSTQSIIKEALHKLGFCLLYTSPSPRD